jgi:toxin-antitoxin system PIN domain toxin
MTYLADVNFWLALAAERHVHHKVAREWFAKIDEGTLAFCRLTQLGFLRLLTNKHVMQEEAMTPENAWAAYSALRSDRRINYMGEPSDLEEIWTDGQPTGRTSPNLWTDAYLCAFARAGGMTLVTFDRKMSPANGIDCIVLGE